MNGYYKERRNEWSHDRWQNSNDDKGQITNRIQEHRKTPETKEWQRDEEKQDVCLHIWWKKEFELKNVFEKHVSDRKMLSTYKFENGCPFNSSIWICDTNLIFFNFLECLLFMKFSLFLTIFMNMILSFLTPTVNDDLTKEHSSDKNLWESAMSSKPTFGRSWIEDYEWKKKTLKQKIMNGRKCIQCLIIKHWLNYQLFDDELNVLGLENSSDTRCIIYGAIRIQKRIIA